MDNKDLEQSQAVVVRSVAPAGYRRGGRAWRPGEQVVARSALSPSQWQQVANDPYLLVAGPEEAAGDSEAGGGVEPHSLGERLTLAQALAELDPADTADFTVNGLPQLDALARLTGRKVTAAERDEAWQAHKAGEAK